MSKLINNRVRNNLIPHTYTHIHTHTDNIHIGTRLICI
jgi:hypothetical protein